MKKLLLGTLAILSAVVGFRKAAVFFDSGISDKAIESERLAGNNGNGLMRDKTDKPNGDKGKSKA